MPGEWGWESVSGLSPLFFYSFCILLAVLPSETVFIFMDLLGVDLFSKAIRI